MPAQTFALGKDAKLYYGVAGATATTEISNVRNVTLNLDSSEADVTTRGNAGWKASVQAMRECSVDFEMLWQPGDTAFEAIRDAFLSGGQVALNILDMADGEGPDGDFSITSFTRNEDLEDAIKASVTAKLAVWREWTAAVTGGV